MLQWQGKDVEVGLCDMGEYIYMLISSRIYRSVSEAPTTTI